IGGAAFTIILLLIMAFGGGKDDQIERRLLRVGGKFVEARKAEKNKPAQSVRRSTTDSGIPIFDSLIRLLMRNPDKLRARLSKTGHNISLGEYLLINIVLIVIAYLVFSF